MAGLRPVSKSLLSRPTIRELYSFVLAPQSYQPRCPQHLSKPSQAHSFKSSLRARRFSINLSLLAAPKSHDRGPSSTEDTQTDFGSLNVLGNTPVPSTSIDACLWDGFHLDSGVKIVGSGVLLVAGEAFAWSPWKASSETSRKNLVNTKGQFDVEDEAWGLLGLVWPKPDLLILGLGKDMRPISPKTRQYINSLGIRVDIQDTRNAAAQFNLLATERGVGSVAAALIPMGWRDGVGLKSL